MRAALRGCGSRARWPVALVVAALAHAGLAWAAWSRTVAPLAEETAATVMMIEFAPTPSAPSARAEDLAPAAQAAQESPAPAPVETRAAEAAEESRAPQTKAETPPLTAQPDAEATPAEATPPETAVVAPRAPAEPARKKPSRAAAASRPVAAAPPSRAAAASRPVAAAPAAVIRSSTAAAPASNLSPSKSELLLSWKGSLLAHINRFKRFPPEARGVGATSVTFTISEAGQVIAARLVVSSGDPALDTEALALLRRASPVPPPPERRTLTLNLPIRFNRQ